MTIRVYNTLTRQKEPFETVVPGRVGIYLCGPTVYKEAHIGHMVGPVIFDTIKRYLRYCGFQVTWVVNITDVDDKLIAQMHERGLPMQEIAEEMTLDYLNNLRALGVDQIDHLPRATEHIPQIITFIRDLIAKGCAYVSEGDVLFDVSRDPHYGQLSHRRPEEQQGEGGEAAAKKRHPGDFALWKAAKPGEPSWDSPWGKGRPGWHIECSAMSWALLGETFDIHGGGLDLVFPHHENELAQSQCRHGKPMVRYWLHNGLLRRGEAAGKIGGRSDRAEEGGASDASAKMSRSAGAGGLADLIAAQGGERIRFFLLRTHYRSTVVYSEQALAEAGAALETFYRYFERFQQIARRRFYTLPAPALRSEGGGDPQGKPLLELAYAARQRFLEKMDDDLNTGGAIAELFDLVRELNKYADQQHLDAATHARDPRVAELVEGTRVLKELTNILGLFRSPPPVRGADEGLLPRVMDLVIALRAEARARKDFATADRIRDALAGLGIVLEDRKGGATEWRCQPAATGSTA